MWRSVGWIAKHQGVTRQTANRWIHEGRFNRTQRTTGGHFRVWQPPLESCVTGYARVSSAKQKTSIETQVKLIQERFPGVEVRRDTGSGFNFQRKGFISILESCLSGNAITVVATTQDRICRVGFPLIRWIVELYGGGIVLLEENDTAEDGFDTSTLVAFVTSFINSYHGKRSGRRKKNTIPSESRDQLQPDAGAPPPSLQSCD